MLCRRGTLGLEGDHGLPFELRAVEVALNGAIQASNTPPSQPQGFTAFATDAGVFVKPQRSIPMSRALPSNHIK